MAVDSCVSFPRSSVGMPYGRSASGLGTGRGAPALAPTRVAWEPERLNERDGVCSRAAPFFETLLGAAVYVRALKGRDIPAQGNALGWIHENHQP